MESHVPSAEDIFFHKRSFSEELKSLSEYQTRKSPMPKGKTIFNTF